MSYKDNPVSSSEPIGVGLFGDHSEDDGTRIEGLLNSLRRAGLSIGPREHIAAGALVSELVAKSADAVVSLADCGPQLASLVARSPEERETFFRIFNTLYPNPPVRPLLDFEFPGSEVTSAKDRPGWQVFATVVGVFVLLITAYSAFRSPDNASQNLDVAEPSFVAEVERGDIAEEDTDSEPARSSQNAESFLRLLEIAGTTEHYSAPTLKEIGAGLARSSPVEWTAEAYTQRLHELTGMPRTIPIQIWSGADVSNDEIFNRQIGVTAKIVSAIDLIERPGQHSGVKEIRSIAQSVAFRRGVADLEKRGIDSWKLLEQWNLFFGNYNFDLPDEKDEALRQLQSVFLRRYGNRDPVSEDRAVYAYINDELIVRALASRQLSWGSGPWSEMTWLRQKEDAPVGGISPWVFWFLVFSPLLYAVVATRGMFHRRRAFLRKRRPEFPPLHMDLLSDARSAIGGVSGLTQKAAQRLSRRMPKASARIDVEGTIRETIKRGGISIHPKNGYLASDPDYLVLIEKHAGGDHEFERMKRLVLQLQPIVNLDLYAYQNDPSLLESVELGRVEPIDRVLARCANHRLLILGKGTGFLDFATGRLLPSLKALLRLEYRALLSPLPLSEWAQEEVDLARELDMPIGRATTEGILDLSKLLGLENAENIELLNPIGDGRARALPEVLRLHSDDYVYSPELDELTIDQLIQDLRNYLDGPGFEWLCALAVYPAIQWDLTLYIGLALTESQSDKPGSTRIYKEERLAAIARLPWLRECDMPNWLRCALISCLSPHREREVRIAIQSLLQSATERSTKLENDQVWFRISEEPLREVNSPEEIFDDEVLLDFMARGKAEDFEANREDFHSQIDNRKLLFRDRISKLAVSCIFVLVAFLVLPKPWSGVPLTGAWLPFVALIVFGAIGLCSRNLQGTYRATKEAFEFLAPFALAFAGIIAAHGVAEYATGALPGAVKVLLFWSVLIAITLFSQRLAFEFGVLRSFPHSNLRSSVVSSVSTIVVGLLALVAIVLADSGYQKFVLIIAGCAIFLASVYTAQFAPEKLLLYKKNEHHRNWSGNWSEALSLAVLAICTIPALLIAQAIAETNQVIPLAEAEENYVAEQLLAVSESDLYFATADAFGTVRLFETKNPESALSVISLDGAPIISMDISETAAGSPTVGIVELDGRVILIDFESKTTSIVSDIGLLSLKPIFSFGLNASEWAIVYNQADGQNVVASHLGVVELPDNREVLAVSSTGRSAQWVLALADGSLLLLDQLSISEAHESDRVTLAPDASFVFSHGEHETVPSIVDLKSNEKIVLSETSSDSVLLAAIGERGNLIAVGYRSGVIRVFDKTGAVLKEISWGGEPENLAFLEFDSTGEGFLAASAEGYLEIWELGSAIPVSTIYPDETLERVEFSENGSHLLWFSPSGKVFLRDKVTVEVVREYSPDDPELARLRRGKLQSRPRSVRVDSGVVRVLNVDGSTQVAWLTDGKLVVLGTSSIDERLQLAPPVPWGGDRALSAFEALYELQRLLSEYQSVGQVGVSSAAEIERDIAELNLSELTDLISTLPLIVPLKDGFYYTSPYGVRIDPFTKKPTWHGGTDFGFGWRAPILASASGRVTYAGVRSGYGRVIDIDHLKGVTTRYAHLSSISVSKGDNVTIGQEIGLMGSTGRSTGPHLHYEIIVNGKTYEPLDFVNFGQLFLRVAENSRDVQALMDNEVYQKLSSQKVIRAIEETGRYYFDCDQWTLQLEQMREKADNDEDDDEETDGEDSKSLTFEKSERLFKRRCAGR